MGSDLMKWAMQRLEEEYYFLATEYVEPGCDQPDAGWIVFANWNGEGMEQLGDVLEEAGVGVEWSDQWALCEECDRAFLTSPTSYFWEPYYIVTGDGCLICKDCEGKELEFYEEVC